MSSDEKESRLSLAHHLEALAGHLSAVAILLRSHAEPAHWVFPTRSAPAEPPPEPEQPPVAPPVMPPADEAPTPDEDDELPPLLAKKAEQKRTMLLRLIRRYALDTKGDKPCAREYMGPLNDQGVAVIKDGPYEHEVQLLWASTRGPIQTALLCPGLVVAPQEVAVASCGNARCLDRKHLRIVPADDARAPKRGAGRRAFGAGLTRK